MLEINLLRYHDKKTKPWRMILVLCMMSVLCFFIYKKTVFKPIVPKPVPVVHLIASIAESIPLDQLKPMGYLEYQSLFKVFLKLPNGELKEVKQGSVVGKENARIKKLDKHHMIFEVNGIEIIKKYA